MPDRAIPASLAAAVLAALATAAPSSRAILPVRFMVSNPAGICQAALPAYEGMIRKRPLAMQNEGSGPAFVTCSLVAHHRYDDVPVNQYFQWAMLRVRSSSGTALTISCTGVWGYGLPSDMHYETASIVLPADGATVDLAWDRPAAGWPGPNPGHVFSASCSLPPGAAVAEGWLQIHDYPPGAEP